MKSADLSSWKCRWFLTWLLCFKGTVTHLEKYKCFTFPFCQNHKWTECICIILSAGDSFPTCQCPRRSWHVCFSSCLQAMWKPAYDFLVTWAAQIGDSYRDVIQELHMGLDKMKNPITKRWKHLTGTLILVNCLDVLRSSAFSPSAQDDYAIWTQALPHTSTPCSSGAIFFFWNCNVWNAAYQLFAHSECHYCCRSCSVAFSSSCPGQHHQTGPTSPANNTVLYGACSIHRDSFNSFSLAQLCIFVVLLWHSSFLSNHLVKICGLNAKTDIFIKKRHF